MKVETQIRLNKFKPREYQKPIMDAILNKGYKRVLAILPRRAGKDIAGFNICVRACLQKVCIIYYIFPTYSQARKVIWHGITNTGDQILDYIPAELISSKNSQEMSIQFINGSRFQFLGSNNWDSLMGTNPQGVVFSEYALQDPRAYQYIRPILTANEGWALFLSTPRGKNHLFELYEIARQHTAWYCLKLTVEDTRHIPLHEIEKERHDGVMSEDLIQQEYYCFTPDMYVQMKDNIKQIKDIEIGDSVTSHTRENRKVTGITKRFYSGEIIIIDCFAAFQVIRCTPNHLFKIVPSNCEDDRDQEPLWKAASELTKEDRLIFPRINSTAKAQSITKEYYEGIVHNISVEEDESYCVAGVAVHNCSFELGVEGSYYSKYIEQLRLKGQIGVVPYESGFRVNTVWDIGYRDSTSIILYQCVGQTVRIIDCYENSKQPLEHYVKVLHSKPYIYGKHFAGHDIAVHELGTGMTRLEIARQLGIKFETKMVNNRVSSAVPDVSIVDGIEAVRCTFGKIWIDEFKCEKLIKALENYRQEYDPKRKVYNSQPLHDWSSHFADAARYMCLSLPKTRDSLSAEDLDRRYRDTVLGPNSNMPSIFRDDLPKY